MTPRNDLSARHDLLRNGVRRFQQGVFPERKEQYEAAARLPQQPHTLFITCADSRLNPELLTSSGPGAIFVTRNVGNLVPPYSEAPGGVAAVIEYALVALQVSQIVVCGHSDCGAMKGLLKRDSLQKLPAVSRWLQNAETAYRILQAKSRQTIGGDTLSDVTKENVLLQLTHLRTHPAVAERIADGTLALYGWVYDIGTGAVLEYDPLENRFSAM